MINITLKSKPTIEAKMMFHKTMAAPILKYKCETLSTNVMTTKYIPGIQAIEMRPLRRVKGCTRMIHVRKKNRKEFNIYNLNDKLGVYRRRWLEHDGVF